MKKIIFTLFALHAIYSAWSQGCIMVRNISGMGQFNLADQAFTNSQWQIGFNTRHFKAYRDFKGTVDQKTPRGDESIVKSFSADLSIDRFMNKGWSIDLSLPYAINSRNASIEHGGAGTPRHTTHTAGLGDIRFTVYKWLLKPKETQKGNIQVGLGIKFATGDYKYQDYFYRNDTTRVLAPVNASIGLGDGGTGITMEINSYYYFSKVISFYGNFYYLLNPRDESGVSTLNGKADNPLNIATTADYYSVPDIYSIRTGLNFNLKNLSLSAGIRDEGVPVYDLLGQNNGLRRPGHNLSAEPGIVYKLKRTSLYAYVPFIVSRKIRQNLTDKRATEMTGIYRIGAGGSGDYSVFLGVLFKL